MKKAVPTLYLFNNIFYPQTIIPLTISDAISKNMMIECFHKNIPVALYYPHARSKGIGTLGKILLIDTLQDGSLSVMVQGITRIKLLDMTVQEPYPLYHFEEYSDVGDVDESNMSELAALKRLHKVLELWLNRHVHSAKERDKFLAEMSHPVKLINNLCMFLIKDVELKQIFLENQSLFNRVRMMNALLVGDDAETEDHIICEAIKNFERLETDAFSCVS